MIAANILKNIRQTFENILPTQDGRTNIPPLDFVVAFIFSLLGDTRISSLESLRREVMKHLGISISRSSFWERLSRKRHLSFLEQIFSELVKQLTIPLLIGDGILKQLCVTDICLIDSTTIRLPEWAAKFFPGTGSSAAVKWHTCINVFSGCLLWNLITSGRTHDRKCFPDHRCSGFFVIFFNMLHIDSLNIICYHYTIIPYLLILSILIDVACITKT